MRSLIAIVGPTGVGKSRVGILVAKALGAEIISGDAYQFYKGLNIGTAKIKPEDMDSVPHHLIDILEPTATFSVKEYQTLARAKIAELHKRSVLPLMVGGAGLYLQAVLYDYRFEGERRTDATKAYYEHLSDQELAELVRKANPLLAAAIHTHNRRRLLRALELAGFKDDTLDAHGKMPYYEHSLTIGLSLPRPVLYERIGTRVDAMIAAGLIEEARGLYQAAISKQAAMAIGYKELFAHFSGSLSLPEAIEAIKRNSRRYAKRQITWFTNQMQPVWFDVENEDVESTAARIIAYVKKEAEAD